jgi:hypothetical protein
MSVEFPARLRPAVLNKKRCPRAVGPNLAPPPLLSISNRYTAFEAHSTVANVMAGTIPLNAKIAPAPDRHGAARRQAGAGDGSR